MRQLLAPHPAARHGADHAVMFINPIHPLFVYLLPGHSLLLVDLAARRWSAILPALA